MSSYHFRQMCISNDELIRFNRKPPNNNNEHDYSLYNIHQDDYDGLDDFSEYFSGTKEESMQHSLMTDADVQQPLSIDETQNFDAPSPSKKRRRYTCPVCGKLWVTPSKLSRHMAVHKHDKESKEKPKSSLPKPPPSVIYDVPITDEVQCPICFCVVESSNKLQQHMLIHVKTAPRKEVKKELIEDPVPIAQKVGPSLYSCTVCGSMLPSSAKLTNHMRNQHMRKISIISNSSNPKVPAKMMARAASDKNFCVICSKVFPTPYKLNRHMVTHSRPKKPSRPQRPRRYACQHCDKKFETPSKLLRHKKVHRDNVQVVKGDSPPVLVISAVTSIMGDYE